jgi:hypothetical protein
MGKLSKKIKRDRSKQAEKDLAQKVNMFDRLPSECGACSAPFDKLNRDMVMTWNVIVREQAGEVNLYCPTCWGKANEIVQDFKKRLEERIKDD